MLNWDKIKSAVEAIQSGLGSRIDFKEDKIVVYSVGENVIRIDIKK